MIGLVFVTHGNLAREFVAAMEHVVGKQKNVECVCIGPEDDMEERRQEILQKAKGADSGSGVLLITDMFGGTPSNLAMSVIGHGNFDVIAGANLPMLIKLASARQNMPLNECVVCAQEAGKKYINVASQLLNGSGK
ncbi:MAG: PTS sugar transporter subunit IIA [Alphaproteobacteria bacterium]|nr:PTS sugar transporter subunit IIA [Alphaproteobacteria bacterium]MDY4688981.1 PTS sugar transporter subunit IIA [Alphaproteobacteria bacterium]